MGDWPVITSPHCAEVCADEFGLSRPEQARAWLYDLIKKRGSREDGPPPELPHLTSPSGFFMVIKGVAALPLAAVGDPVAGTARWMAVDCEFYPSYLERYGRSQEIDPLPLRGATLLRHIHLTKRVVDRFQRLCAADPNPEIAREELWEILAEDAWVSTEPPDWCRNAPEADFYLIAGDEYLLPLKRRSRIVFDASGLIHRASGLFMLRGPDLAVHCRYLESTLARGSRQRDVLQAALQLGGHLSWRRPQWARPHPRAQFWVVLSPTLCAPVAWEPDRPVQPLLLLDLMERQSLLARLAGRVKPAPRVRR